jgi:energy-converting hydrogenase Eha subunit A
MSQMAEKLPISLVEDVGMTLPMIQEEVPRRICRTVKMSQMAEKLPISLVEDVGMTLPMIQEEVPRRICRICRKWPKSCPFP